MCASTILRLFCFFGFGLHLQLHGANSSVQELTAQLNDVVIIDQDRVYSTDPKGHAQAHELVRGQRIWLSEEIARPLLIDEQHIIAWGSTLGPGKGQLLVLDAIEGKLLQRVPVSLPNSVWAQPIATPEHRFFLRSRTIGNQRTIFWQYEARSPHRIHSARAPQIEEGALRLSVGPKGQWRAQSVKSSAPPTQVWELLPAQRMPGVAGRQFRAADDQYVLISEAKPDALFGTQYNWTLHTRADSQTSFTLTLPFSFAPFLVKDDRLMTVLPMYGARDGHQFQFFPERFVVFDLHQKRERFAIEILGQDYIGELPP